MIEAPDKNGSLLQSPDNFGHKLSAPDVLTLWEFFQAFVANNRVSLVLHPCHREICELYELAVLGEMPGYEYFVVNMPRRVGKTKILEALACWMFGEFGDAQMIYSSYSDKLVARSIAYARRTLMQPWYIDLYGDRVHGQRTDLVTTVEGGTLYGAGTSATITGFGAGLKEPAGGFIAIDDPAKPDESLSVVESQNVQQNFETTFKGCRNSDRYAPIIINAQRLGPEDLPGYVLKTYPNQTYHLKIPCFINGKSQFPETWSDTTHDQLQSTRLGRFVLASQFQQEPVSLGGNLIPVDKFQRYDLATAKTTRWEKLIIPIDTALKIKQANDFSAVALWGLYQKRAYLIDLMHGKWESPELLANVTAFWEKWQHVEGWPRPRMIIEEKAAGTPLLQNLNRQRVPAVGIERDIDKVRRVQSILPYVETGCVVIPREQDAPEWLGKWIQEHAAFSADGTAAHDDMCLVEGTLIITDRGEVPIEEVTTKDFVFTRTGWHRVKAAGCTGIVCDLWIISDDDGRSLAGTGNHPVYTHEEGFCRIDTISDGMTLSVCEITLPPVLPTWLFSTGSNFEDTPTQRRKITAAIIRLTRAISAQASACFTKLFGRQRMVRFLKVVSSTISTSISGEETTIPSHLIESNYLGEYESSHRHGTNHPREGNGIEKWPKLPRQIGQPLLCSAPSAERNLSPKERAQSHAPNSAAVDTEKLARKSPSAAPAAEKNFRGPWWIPINKAKAVSVRKVATTRPVAVFNLEVECAHEYFANGILVHNCDTTVDGVEGLLGKPLSSFDVLMTPKKP